MHRSSMDWFVHYAASFVCFRNCVAAIQGSMVQCRALLLHTSRSWQAAKEGLVLVSSSAYLRALCAFMLLQYVCSSLFYFEKSLVVAAAGQDAAHRTAFFGAINSAAALCILVLQLLVTGAR